MDEMIQQKIRLDEWLIEEVHEPAIQRVEARFGADGVMAQRTREKTEPVILYLRREIQRLKQQG